MRLISSTALLGFVVVVLSVPLGALLHPESWASVYELVVDTISGESAAESSSFAELDPLVIDDSPSGPASQMREAPVPPPDEAPSEPATDRAPEPAASPEPTPVAAPEPAVRDEPTGGGSATFERWIEDALVEDPPLEDDESVEARASATSSALTELEEERVKQTYRSALDALQRSRSRR
jgi:hypothetical protein